jgi:hypothetical protein
MAKLLVNDVHIGNDSELLGDDLNNYKGFFHGEGNEQEEKYYEHGAHFPYKTLYSKLENLKKVLSPSRLEETSKGKALFKFSPISEGY